MLSLLRTRRWQAFTAAAVVAIIAFGLLSLWQWHRAEEKRQDFAAVESALRAPPLPADQVADPAEWQAVDASGRYVPEQQYLVRNQPQDGRNGYWVVTLLDTDSGSDLWVVRGWVPVDLAKAATQTPPTPPAGEVTVAGYARNSESGPLRAGTDLPQGQISRVAVAELDGISATTTSGWFLVAARDPALAPVPPPQPTDSRNLSYAGQWLLFAAITVGGWFFFLRREAQDEAAARDDAAVPVASGR